MRKRPVASIDPAKQLPPRRSEVADLVQRNHELREDGLGVQEDQPSDLTVYADVLNLVREAYENDVTGPERLLQLAENAQPNVIQDQPSMEAYKIIASLNLINDNDVNRNLLNAHAIMHVHKLQRNKLAFLVNSKGNEESLGRTTVHHLRESTGIRMPLYYNATYVSEKLKVLSGILRFYMNSRERSRNLLVKRNVCSQLLLDGVLYAVKGIDAPPQYYHF
ncbi:hypothetical protein PHMEG_0001244 [Phytophthora megakarya]|uniref:Uncharacterized protein n=1 Tax=Phytophthora megakarya TaxID=4795 RepID=A0A225X138_9STRA|nr:hypothetical protein PHMEG_0001244 [Phytophthora megakarya]